MFIEFFNGNADLGSTVATVVTTVVVLMFGEITPKGLAKNMPERFAMFATPAISVCMVIFKPINLFISLWQKLVYKIFKVEVDRGVTEEELVSSDFIGDPHSCVIDLPLIDVVDGNMIKVVAWYDNEWGYSCRVVDLAAYIGK